MLERNYAWMFVPALLEPRWRAAARIASSSARQLPFITPMKSFLSNSRG